MTERREPDTGAHDHWHFAESEQARRVPVELPGKPPGVGTSERSDVASPAGPDRKFQINPGPLKVVPARLRAPFGSGIDHNYGRCKATTRQGLRCLRDAVDGDYCHQHRHD